MSTTNVAGLVYGGDYNAEQWPEHVWREDFSLMREAGVSMVTVGVFAWAALEPRPGVYEFGWLDRLLDGLAEHGIAADLATATASPPAWLVRAHPEILPVTAHGVRLEFGSRQHICPSSGAFREHAVALVEQIAQRYKGHPALAMWHIGNEYGDHVVECYCAESARHFRQWLSARYGDIDELNNAWGTSFWSQHYGDWDEIEPPRAAPGPVNPTQQLDWRRFSNDAWLDCYRAEKNVLRRLSPDVPVTTNFMGAFKSLDYWAWAAEEDIVTNDAYPDPADPEAHINAAMSYDLMRSLRAGQPWLLLESAPSAVSWRPVNVPKPAGVQRLWGLQAVAHGADGVMFFQWRASRAGAEKFHSAMLGHRGTDGRGWADTVALGTDLRRLAEVADTRTVAQVGILLDWESWWALELDEHPSQQLRQRDLLEAWYRPLWSRNIAVDFVPPSADLSAYRLLLAPNLYLVDDECGQALTEYVRGGGHLAVGFFSGVVDAHDHVHPTGMAQTLAELLGVIVDEWWPMPDGATTAVGFDDTYVRADQWQESLETTGASVVARYDDGELAGQPAVTRNVSGAGTAWYVSCRLDESGFERLMDHVLSGAGVQPVLDAPAQVEVTMRESADATYLFLLNHGQTTATATLSCGGVDLLTEDRVGGTTKLQPHALAVVRLDPEVTE